MNAKLRQGYEIEALHELLDELDYYQLLGISADSGPEAIEPGFREWSRKLHPDRVGRLGNKSWTRKATAIYRVINEGYRVLRDPDTRTAYGKDLQAGRKRLSDTGKADAKASSGASGDPAQAARTEKGGKYWRLALQNWRDADYNGCVMNIQFALSFEKDNETFQEWLDRAKAQAKSQNSKKKKNPYKLRF
jgi:curved DNA-binding protein CbpA